MVIFGDTSALYALLNARDLNHERAKTQWLQWLTGPADIVVSNYIVLETTALVQKRLGMQALRQFYDLLLPAMDVYWVSEETHRQAVQMLMASNRRQLSLVDCSSFVLMNALGISTVFSFDQHFAQAGFTVIPMS